MADLKTFLAEIATDASKLGEFLLEPESVMESAGLSDEDKVALRSGVPAMIGSRLAGNPAASAFTPETPQQPNFVFPPPPQFVIPPQFVVPPQFVAPPHFVVPPQFVAPPQFVVHPPPQFVVHPPPQFVVHPPPQFVVHPPPQFVVHPPPQFVVQPPLPAVRTNPGAMAKAKGKPATPRKGSKSGRSAKPKRNQ